MPALLLFSLMCKNLFCSDCGLGLLTRLWWVEYSRGHGMSLPRWDYKKTVASLLGTILFCTVSCLLTCLFSGKPDALWWAALRRALCCKEPREAPDLRQGAEALSPRAQEEINPAHNHKVSLEASPPPVEPLHETAAPDNLIPISWEALSQGHPAKSHSDPCPTKIMR